MVTALINILDKDNRPVRCRTLLDTAATSNLITENLAESLGIQKQKYSLAVGGLGDIQTSTSYRLKATIQSRFNNFEKTLEFYTVPEITKQHPNNYIDKRKFNLSNKINLADPTFNIPGNIDLLIGAGPALSSFITGQKDISIPEGPDLFLQNTQFGWVIGGAISINNKSDNINSKQQNIACHITTIQALQQLSKTWAIEEGSKQRHLSEEEKACENHYETHTTRREDGSYVVALPFNSKQSLLGETRTRALNRFKSLENKFKRNPEFAKQYKAIMQEYIDLGHMEPSYNSTGEEGFYLPHHAVTKESSNTTKHRVVFDGSAKSSTGLSLNDTLMVGATIQQPLFNHLIRFRMYPIIIVGDIEKMFRYLWVREQDRKYLKVIWRDEAGNIKDYQLTIDSFGTSSATFLAVRTLQQLAEDEEENYPEAAKIVREGFYVDDGIIGAETIEDAIKLRLDVTQLLRKGGFKIRQWASNESKVLEGLTEEEINKKLQIDTDPMLKTLGIYWQTQSDLLIYELNKLPVYATMRIILAEIAKIFDPLGLLGPLILAARLILQECWRQEVTWDQELPKDIQIAWQKFTTEFNNIPSIKYNRSLVTNDTCDIQLHGFADASEKAYGACIYLRRTTITGETQVNLLCAKTKIAPLQTQTLARLELCAALLLANLYESVRELLPIQLSSVTFWSDSTIVLNWIKTPPYQLKTFVANRVAEIQSKTPITSWKHVRSEDNPADACSRGQSPEEFVQNALWRSGPDWLNYPENQWQTSIIPEQIEDNERKKLTCLTTCVNSESIDDLFIKYFSSPRTLHRATARLLRLGKNNKFNGKYTIEEIRHAQIKIIKLIQSLNFPKDIHNLTHKQNIHEDSKLKLLSPFLDEDGIIRVGGRLSHANISFDQKHPIILPQSHPYTKLIIEEAHIKHFHAGPQTTLYAVRRRFWPLNSRNEVKRVTQHCVTCIKAKPKTATYPMGELPRERVSQSRPFYHTGVDYCGPFYIKEKKYRNRGKIKVYVAVFICLAVKATHLEVVSDLTSDGFIAALRRFISRRGKCHSIHSDNGTNFTGANNQLREIYQQINSEEHQEKVQRYLTDEGIQWKFIPARSPNFGGLWEAAVKSFKNHLVRIVGDTLVTFEELNTFITEIEAILNSRPLTLSSSDPNDPIAITPGHFLIGDSLTSLPDWDWTDVASNRLSSWQLIQKLKQAFWKRWHKEYINGLNMRSKWRKGSHDIKEDTVVIIKEDNTRPLQWPIGRVIQTHPGSDGIIRTVTIKTPKGVIDRNVRKLAVLFPSPNNNECN